MLLPLDRPFPFAPRAVKWDGLASQTSILTDKLGVSCFSYLLARQTIPVGAIDRCDSAEEGALVTCKVSPANDAWNFSCIPFDRSGEAVNLPHPPPPPFWGAGCPAVGEPVRAIGFASLSPVIVLANGINHTR